METAQTEGMRKYIERDFILRNIFHLTLVLTTLISKYTFKSISELKLPSTIYSEFHGGLMRR